MRRSRRERKKERNGIKKRERKEREERERKEERERGQTRVDKARPSLDAVPRTVHCCTLTLDYEPY